MPPTLLAGSSRRLSSTTPSDVGSPPHREAPHSVEALENNQAVLQEQIHALADSFAALQQEHQQLLMQVASSSGSATEGGAKSPDSFVTPAVLRSVVKIFAGVAGVNHIMPWHRKLQTNVSGTGFVIDKKRRLLGTNAHVIAKSTSLVVRRHGAGQRHVAEIVFIAADCDFAILHVDDEAFWAEAEEAQFDGVSSEDARAEGGLTAISALGPSDGLPDLQAQIKVVGFPWGGDQVSITSGVVSRVDMTTYGGVDGQLLGIQIDAAINSGNSGGPALVDGKVVGIAFQTLVAASNIGYLIPTCLAAVAVRTYVAALARRHADAATAVSEDPHVQSVIYHNGFASLGVGYQDLTNQTLRHRHGLTDGSMTGCLIEHVFPRTSAAGQLKVGDVILSVNGMDVADDGTVEWKPDQRFSFAHFVRATKIGDLVSLRILRAGETTDVSLEARVPHAMVPSHFFTDYYREVVPYRIFGGCAFTELTMSFLLEWGDPDWYNNAPRFLTQLLYPHDSDSAKEEDNKEEGSDEKKPPRDSVVVLSQILPHSVNRGYHAEHFTNRFVTSVNGTSVRSFEHFCELLETAEAEGKDANMQLSNGSMCLTLVMNAAEAVAADKQLLPAYGIPSGVRLAPMARQPTPSSSAGTEQAAAADETKKTQEL